jgi:hypothetical protein
MEIWILDMLQREIGHEIPIQEFFDLVVGTSAGKNIPQSPKFDILNMNRRHYRSWYLQDELVCRPYASKIC